jgi:hypothetical protein
MNGPTASTIHPTPDGTPTDASVSALIRQARALGLSVMLKPHVDCGAGCSRTTLAPTDIPQWQASYRSFLLRCARLAQRDHAEMLCIGTELTTLSGKAYESYWRSLITKTVKPNYTGLLTYAANWDAYDEVTFWDALDYAGVDAYFRLPPRACPTRDALRQAWLKLLPPLQAWQAKHGRPVLLTEVGYGSVDHCGAQPNAPDLSQPYSECCQAHAYGAALDVVATKPWIQGVFFWYWDPLAPHPAAHIPAFTPQDKLAQDTMSLAFGGPGRPTGADPALFGFERGSLRWVRQMDPHIRGITGVWPSRDRARYGSGSLKLTCDLRGGNADWRNGEAFVDLRYLGLGNSGASFNLNGQPVTGSVWCPTGARGDAATPNRVRLVVKDAGWHNLYSAWSAVNERRWLDLSVIVSATAPPDGYADPGFDPTAIGAVGLDFSLGEGSTASYAGPIYLDGVTVGNLGAAPA